MPITFVNSEYGPNLLDIRSVVPKPMDRELYLVVKTSCKFSWQCTWL